MITGRTLVVVLILLATWLSFLVWALWNALRNPQEAGRWRSYSTVAGLACSITAVGSLFGFHLSWISPGVSQYLAVGTIRVLSTLLFWSSMVGLILTIAGSGRIRFLGAGTCVATGLWWLAVAMETAISMGAPIARHPTRYLIPKGYIGWVMVEYGQPALPLPMANGKYISRIPANGLLRTSSLIEDGWAKDEYFYYSEDGSLQDLPETGWGGGGMIWAGSIGKEAETDSARQLTENFYVGTEDQFHRNEGHPRRILK